MKILHMNKEPLISIIVPLYNHELFVQETLKSLIAQSYPDLELIVLNDGSRDRSHEKMLEMEDACKKRFIRFIYINKQREGVARTLNRGIQLAQSEFIFFTASDDVAFPDTIRKLAEKMFLSGPDAAVVCGDSEFIDKDNKRVCLGLDGSIYYEYIPGRNFRGVIEYCEKVFRGFDASKDFGTYRAFLRSNHIPVGRLARKSALIEEGLFDEDCVDEDYDMALKLSKRYKIVLVNEYLMRYRLHPTNTIRTMPKELAQSLFRLFFREKEYCLAHGFQNLWMQRMFRFLVYFLGRRDLKNASLAYKQLGFSNIFKFAVLKIREKLTSTGKPTIAILGTRGIPANYGGFETVAEELSTRLALKGYSVAVYNRKGNSPFKDGYYKGVKLIEIGTIRHKYLDTVAHAFFCTWHVIFTSVDIVYYCNAINSVFTVLPRLFGKKVVINVDGLEWKRKKWNGVAKLAYRISEWLATLFASAVITDSKAVQEYYKKKFNFRTVYISYGANAVPSSNGNGLLAKYNLKPRGYVLYVSRLEPENNAHTMIEAYEKVKSDMPLLIVGSAPYSKRYIDYLKRTTDSRIRFLGSIYGDGYHELQNNAYIYLHGNEVGGTNPALLEALASGNCVIANGVPFNHEVVGDAGLCYEPDNADDLKDKIEYLLRNPQEVDEFRIKAVERMRKNYNWDDVVIKYEEFFRALKYKVNNEK